jgi:hypothetical protein
VEKIKKCTVIKSISDYSDAKPGTDILTNQRWTPKSRKNTGGPINITERMVNDFKTRTDKDGIRVTKDSHPMARRIKIFGTMSKDNIDEVHKSIQYSIYFNFSNPSTMERQIIVKVGDLKLYMSPNFKCRPEFTGNMDSGKLTYSITQNPISIASNATNCAVEITPDILKYLPYHARTYITKWATAQYNRKASLSTAATKIVPSLDNPGAIPPSFIPKPPRFNLLALDPTAEDYYYVRTNQPINFLFPGNVVKTTTRVNNILTNVNPYFDDPMNVKVTLSVVPGLNMFNPTSGTTSTYTENVITVVNAMYPTATFNAKVSSYDRASGVLVLNNIVNMSPNFEKYRTTPYVYVVYVANTVGGSAIDFTNRVDGFTVASKYTLLNKIAQCFYKFNTNKKIGRIVDVFQVGDTLFDVRYTLAERDSQVTAKIRESIKILRETYEQYRVYNLTQNELLNLDTNYNTNLDYLNSQLEIAIKEVPTDCGPTAQYITLKRVNRSDPKNPNPGFIKLCQIEVIGPDGINIALGAIATVPQDVNGQYTAYLDSSIGEDATGNVYFVTPDPAKIF